jgi:hypothetical protein
MTTSNTKKVSDKQLAQITRQFMDMVRRMNEETLDAGEISWLFQQVQEGNLSYLCHPNGMGFAKNSKAMFLDLSDVSESDDLGYVSAPLILAEGIEYIGENDVAFSVSDNRKGPQSRHDGFEVELVVFPLFDEEDDGDDGDLKYYKFETNLPSEINDNIWVSARLLVEAEEERILARWLGAQAMVGIHMLHPHTVLVHAVGPNRFCSEVAIPLSETKGWLKVDERFGQPEILEPDFLTRSSNNFYQEWYKKTQHLRREPHTYVAT